MRFANFALLIMGLGFVGVLAGGSISSVGGSLLVFQWPYSICSKAAAPKGACFIPTFVSGQELFTLHGFWPEYADFSGGPQNCTSSKYNKNTLTSALRSEMQKYWPTMITKNSNDSFWAHEFEKHGTCSSLTGNTQNAYFAGALDLARPYFQGRNMLKGQVLYDHPYKYSELAALMKSMHGFDIALKCATEKVPNMPNVRMIKEVQFCYGTDSLEPIDCPAAIMNFVEKGCGTGGIIFPAPWKYE